jgi:hypothetical protein
MTTTSTDLPQKFDLAARKSRPTHRELADIAPVRSSSAYLSACPPATRAITTPERAFR